jgi:nucleotide-binding universal stress UspA family protein
MDMRVLLAVDGSANAEEVFDAAAPWIRMTGSRAELLTVIDESEIHSTYANEYLAPITPLGVAETGTALEVREPPKRVAENRSQAFERAEAEAKDRLQALAAKHLPRVEYDIHVVAGDNAAEAILEQADELAVDVIAVGAEGRRLWRSGDLGTVAKTVLERAAVPVFVVREHTGA